MALLMALPFLFVAAPPMDDYPAHLASYHVLLDLARSPELQRYYRLTWTLTGNMGVELAIRPLAALVGLERAGQIVAVAVPVVTALALIVVEWSLRARVGIGTLLAMMAIWSPPLRMGFLNYALSLALALLAFAIWIRVRNPFWRALVFIPVGLGVWLCHMSGWGILGLSVLGFECWSRRNVAAALASTWPLWPPAALMLASGHIGDGFDWGPSVFAYKKDMFFQALRGEARIFDIACVGLLILAMVEARSRRLLDWRLMTPALMLLGTALIMPRHFGGGDFADARLVPVFLMLGCQALDVEMLRPAAFLIAAALLLRLALLSHAWNSQSNELREMLVALNHIPEGARVASAVVHDVDAWGYYPFSHIGTYATLRRNALTNAHFATEGIHFLQLRDPDPGFSDPSQEVMWRNGETVDLRNFAPARKADYLWYVGPAQMEPKVILPQGAIVAFADERSLLVRMPPHR